MKCKIAVVGTTLVGKTALIRMYMQSIFPEYYEETLEDVYRKQIMTVDRQPCLLEIIDTGGLYNECILEEEIRLADGFICVYQWIVYDRLS